MSGYKKSSGSNVALTVRKRNTGGVMVDIANGYRRQSGAWVSIFATAYGVTASPGTSSKQANRGQTISESITATVTGGTGPFTYSWTWFSGGAGITISNATSATCTISSSTATGAGDITRSGTLRCTVTDTGAGSVTASTDVPVSWTWLGV